jgi:hypothetical protein
MKLFNLPRFLKLALIASLLLTDIGIAQADIFLIYDLESGCVKSRFSYQSINDYLQKSKESFGNDFTVIRKPKTINNGDGQMAKIKLNLNGKVYSPVVFEGDAVGCAVVVKNAKEAEAIQEVRDEMDKAGSRYFCESFFGHPCPTSGKNHATANACGCPSRPESLVRYPARG